MLLSFSIVGTGVARGRAFMSAPWQLVVLWERSSEGGRDDRASSSRRRSSTAGSRAQRGACARGP